MSTELAFPLLLIGLLFFLLGLNRMGFVAGLWTFVGFGLLCVFYWPLAIFVAVAVAVYGLADSLRTPSFWLRIPRG